MAFQEVSGYHILICSKLCWQCLSGLFRMWVATCLALRPDNEICHWLSTASMYVYSPFKPAKGVWPPSCSLVCKCSLLFGSRLKKILLFCYKTTQVTSLPTIKNVLLLYNSHPSLLLIMYICLAHHWSSTSSFDYWYFTFSFFGVYLTWYLISGEAIILILKHATFLRLSNLNLSTAETALAQAELDYQEAKMDLKVQQHLAVSSHEHTAELSAGFILASDFGLFLLACVRILISHQSSSSAPSVVTQNTYPKKR